MASRVRAFKISGKQLVQILNTTGAYERLAMDKLEDAKEYSIEIFEREKVDGPWRPSITSPPRYAESFSFRKVGLNYRLVNRDPGAHWVEWGSHAGGVVPILRYLPMRGALDRLEAQERL